MCKWLLQSVLAMSCVLSILYSLPLRLSLKRNREHDADLGSNICKPNPNAYRKPTITPPSVCQLSNLLFSSDICKPKASVDRKLTRGNPSSVYQLLNSPLCLTSVAALPALSMSCITSTLHSSHFQTRAPRQVQVHASQNPRSTKSPPEQPSSIS